MGKRDGRVTKAVGQVTIGMRVQTHLGPGTVTDIITSYDHDAWIAVKLDNGGGSYFRHNQLTEVDG
jgi:hypothetical protein